MTDLFVTDAAELEERAISPIRELGAYEALWANRETSFKKLALLFRENPGRVPSDFVAAADAQKYARMAIGAIRQAGIQHFGIRVHGAGEYPDKLRRAEHPIELLYYQGTWDLVVTRCVAIVGTRKPSADGEKRAAKLARRFVDAEFTVVSGLASGIDSVVHRTAISAGGRTIAVIGTPITEAYPKENAELQRSIADRHLVISQIPVVRYSQQTFRGNRLFFPERNITMSALTEATVIVEAGNTSGTLIQAEAAIAQGRKLFILDSCFRNPELTWPAKFERLGAVRVSEFEDIERHLASSETLEDRCSDTAAPQPAH